MAGATTTTKPKRGRGRPRKHPKKKVAEKAEKVESKKTTPKTTTKKTEPKVEKSAEKPVEEKVEKVETAPIAEKEEPIIEEAVSEEVTPVIEEEMSEEATVTGFEIDETESVGSDYSPLADPVISRGYEGGNNPIATEESEGYVPSAQLTYEDDIPSQAEATATESATTTNTEQTSASPNGSPQSQPSSGFSAASQSNKTEEKKSFWDNSHSSSASTTTESPAEKKRNATKMADTLLLLYQSNVPLLFQSVAKFNEGKISRMELNGEIDLLMPVMEDGTTVGQYIQSVNAQVEKTFVITDEQVAEVREPLIDYLMEKDFKMTPSQRLLAAMIGQLFTLGIGAFAQWRQNRHALNQFAEFTADWRRKNGGGADIPTQAQAQPQSQPQSAEDVAGSYAPVDEEPVHGYETTEQPSTPYDNISDHDGAEANNLMARTEDEVISVEVEEIPNEEDSHLDLNSYLMEDDAPHNEDIPM